MTSEEGALSGQGSGEHIEDASAPAGRRPLGTPDEIRSAFLAPSSGGGPGQVALQPARPRLQASSTSAIQELGLTVTGLGLSLFMLMHMSLLSSVLLGEETFDRLASFLERYYLLQAGAPVLVLVIIAHVVFALRKVPVSLRQQGLLLGLGGAMRHLDTLTWGLQMLTALVLAALVSIHLGDVLTGVPIEAAKSGARVQERYLWFDAPFIVAVYSHMLVGLYRVCVKWGVEGRRLLRGALLVLAAAAFGMGAVITAALYRLGGGA